MEVVRDGLGDDGIVVVVGRILIVDDDDGVRTGDGDAPNTPLNPIPL